MRSRPIQLGPVLITNHLYHCIRIIENYTLISITIPSCVVLFRIVTNMIVIYSGTKSTYLFPRDACLSIFLSQLFVAFLSSEISLLSYQRKHAINR